MDAATSVLATRGYHAMHVAEVVSRSGTSKGGFYFHFPSKEQMVVALVEQLAQRLVQKVESAMALETVAHKRLAIAVDTLLRTLAQQRGLARVLFLNVAGESKRLDQNLLPMRRRFAGLVARELDGAVAQGAIPPQDCVLASQVWIGAFHEVLLAWLTEEPNPSLEATIPRLQRILFASVGLSILAPAAASDI